MVIDRSFWRGRRVLLTGHTGFKGAWLSLTLNALGARVTGVALPAEAGSLFELAKVSPDIDDRQLDIRDQHALQAVILESNPEIVFHLAAQPLVRYSYADPLSTFSTNVMGTANLLNALKGLTELRAAVVVTSDKVYFNEDWVWAYRETDRLGGRDPYSASKSAAEIITLSMAASFFDRGATVSTARAGNVVGGGDFAADRLVPDIVRALKTGKSVSLRNPMAIRPWQHVMDPILGYLALAYAAANSRAFQGAFNFGPSVQETMTVEALVKCFFEAYGRSTRVEFESGDNQPYETTVLRVDSTKARTLLNWRPLISTNDAIVSAAEWYRAAENGADLAIRTRAEVEEFLRRARAKQADD